MKTRYKKYKDYGLTKKMVAETYTFLNTEITEEEKMELVEILAMELPQSVYSYIAMALLEHKSFNKVERLGFDYCKSDFYGYKRKGLFLARQYMERRKQ